MLLNGWFGVPLLGLAAILTAACTLNPQAPFPGFNALAPVLGAALVIYPRESAAGRLLSGRPFVFVGLISYSLYLWHWPIIVFWRVYKNGIPLSSADEIAVTALSFFLSALSWRFIEQPARRIRVGSATVLTGALIAAATVAAVLVPVLWTGGFPSRLPADALALGSKAEMWDWKCPLSIDLGMLVYPNTTGSVPSCALGANWKTAHHRAIVWGDSIAESIEPLLDVAGRQERVAIAFMPACLVITNQGAPRRIMPSGPEYDKWCDAARTRVLAILSAHPEIDLVLMSTSWSFAPGLLDWRSLPNGTELMKAGLDGLLSDMEAAGRRTLIVGDIPAFLGPDPTSCVMALHALPRMPCPRDPEFIPRSTIPFETSAHAALKEVAAAHAHATVIDPLDFLCDDVRCRTYVAGEFIYRDAVHLRRNLRPETISALAELFQFRPFFAR